MTSLYIFLRGTGSFLKNGFKKAFMTLFVVMLVVAFSPLALLFGGVLMVFALICGVFVIVGFCFGISALFWIVQWFMNIGSGRSSLPWI